MIYISLTLCLFFSFLNINWETKNFPLAFFISIILTLALLCSVIFSLKSKDIKKLFVTKKIYEYLPIMIFFIFILKHYEDENTDFLYDFISTIFIIVIIIFSFFIQKKINTMISCPKSKNYLEKTKINKKYLIKIFFSVLGTYIKIIFIVFLLNQFIFQIYEIPTESMVPKFFIGDRVLVSKISSKFQIPLTDITLYQKSTYNRGDIIAFNNPSYHGKRNEAKSLINSFIYLLSLKKINLNIDNNKQIIINPIVKRVVGLPGEQLVMVDGKLYKRISGNNTFEIIQEDLFYALGDYNTLDNTKLDRIRKIPVSDSDFKIIEKIEKDKNEINFSEINKDFYLLFQDFISLYTDEKHNKNHFEHQNLYIYDFYKNFEQYITCLFNSQDSDKWIYNFLFSWLKNLTKTDFEKNSIEDPFQDSMLKINLMLKKYTIEYILDLKRGNSIKIKNEKIKINEILTYFLYSDMRNMPVFPPNKNNKPSYIDTDSYFLLGDNRFNSKDFRFGETENLIKITDFDDFSFKTITKLKPYSLSKEHFLGKIITLNYKKLFVPFAK